jgi:hypothetical protein
MKIIVPKVDLRGDNGSRSVDDETGTSIGQLLMGKERGRTIILFDGKYQGTFETQAECDAFAKGRPESYGLQSVRPPQLAASF